MNLLFADDVLCVTASSPYLILLDFQLLISFLVPLVDVTSYRTVTQLDLCLPLSLSLSPSNLCLVH